MTRATLRQLATVLALATAVLPSEAAAQITPALPTPLGLSDVIRLAGERRDEIEAARARTRAGEARPAIVSALADPMISPSLGHLPFLLGGADVSVTIEQQIRDAMLNTSLARHQDGPVPELAPLAFAQPLPNWSAVKSAVSFWPELAAGCLDESFERHWREGRIQRPEDVDAAVVEGASARVRPSR